MLVVLIDVLSGVMMNDEVAEVEGGSGISKDRLFVRAPDIKISQELVRARLGKGLLT